MREKGIWKKKNLTIQEIEKQSKFVFYDYRFTYYVLEAVHGIEDQLVIARYDARKEDVIRYHQVRIFMDGDNAYVKLDRKTVFMDNFIRQW